MQYTIHRLETVTSTNDVALGMIEEGAPEGTVVVADEQIGGRGRRGRQWISPPGTGLYLSVVLRPSVPSSKVWQLAFVASLAAAEAIRWSARLEPQIKWPNDVLLNGSKLCGILIESGRSPSSPEPAVVVGIGINVNTLEFPPEIADRATSIAAEKGEAISIRVVERMLLESVRRRYEQYLAEGFRPILNSWMQYDCTVGREVEVQTADGVVKGTAVEVTPLGNLKVRLSDGSRKELTAGDVLLTG